MRVDDPIEAYLGELGRELRVSRWARRRILVEARAHLLEAAEAELAHGIDAASATERALARFGLASDTARQFDGVRSTRTVLLRRALVPWVAAAVVTSMASASVWAFQPGTSAAHVHAHSSHIASHLQGSTRARPHPHTIRRQPPGRGHQR
jgi:hypothetical protein